MCYAFESNQQSYKKKIPIQKTKIRRNPNVIFFEIMNYFFF